MLYHNQSKRNDYIVQDFNKFIQNRLTEIKNDTFYKIYPYLEGHWRPQYLYIYDKNNKIIVKHILKYENLDIEFSDLMKQYNLNINLDSHDNVGNWKYNVDDLTQETKLMIQEIYQRDFIEFVYPI